MSIAPPTVEHRVLPVKWAVLGLLVYWLLYALLAPVTIYDSHVYNIARLLIIQKGGFFGNHVWNVVAQISYPWGFDAVHYPFLSLGGGYDLPSFACFVGILVVIHQRVSLRYGPAKAWWCALALLAMPTVVYEATSTKNDLAGVFAVAVWFYALGLWNERGRRIYLFWMALALSFLAGTKLSGPPLTAILTVYTFWRLRRMPRRQLVELVGALAVTFLLFGSAETYLNNYLLFKNPLGQADYIRFHQNIDGVAGGVANFVRYFFGAMDVGVDACNPQSPVAAWLTDAGRGTLHFMGLENVGYRRDYSDSKFVVLKMGLEAASDYGPVGTLALIAAFCLVVARRPGDPLWKISACGLAAMAQVCLTVGWMPWNNRFLLLPFVLFGVGFTLYALREGPRLWTRQILLLLLLIFSAVIYPLHSFNRRPADFLSAVTHREALETSERTTMSEIVGDLKARVRSGQAAPLLLTAGEDSWTYDILEIKGLDVLPTPTVNEAALAAAEARTHAPRLLVLALNRPLDPAVARTLRPLNAYEESNTFLYEWQREDVRATDTHPSLVVHFADGWYAEERSPVGSFRWMSAIGRLNVVSSGGSTLVIGARVRSIVPGNGVELFVDDHPAASDDLPGTDWKECQWRVPVPPGAHRVSLRSRLPGQQPPGDGRTLALCVENFQTSLEP